MKSFRGEPITQSAYVQQRFWSKVNVSGDCWLWQGPRTTNGYGNLRWGNADHMAAHRYSYALHHGPIADGLFVCHRCDTPTCVRPEHLFLGTHRDNMRDCAAKGRIYSPLGAASCCPNGHAYTDENTARTDSGRRCRTCLARSRRAVSARRRAQTRARVGALTTRTNLKGFRIPKPACQRGHLWTPENTIMTDGKRKCRECRRMRDRVRRARRSAHAAAEQQAAA